MASGQVIGNDAFSVVGSASAAEPQKSTLGLTGVHNISLAVMANIWKQLPVLRLLNLRADDFTGKKVTWINCDEQTNSIALNHNHNA